MCVAQYLNRLNINSQFSEMNFCHVSGSSIYDLIRVSLLSLYSATVCICVGG